uniref:Secreted protein n=1 Tax=Panagrolaimus superbus TaxID=310955 RepID=A0A914Y1D9_9BILA
MSFLMLTLTLLLPVALVFALDRRESLRPNIRLFGQRNGQRTLLVTPIEGDGHHVYTWSKCGEERKSIQGTRQPLPLIKLDTSSGNLLSLIPNHEHYCIPQVKDTVRGVQLKRGELAEVASTRNKPAAVRVNIAERVTRQYAPYDRDTRANIAAAAKGPSKSALARAVQRVRKTLYPNIIALSDIDALPPKQYKNFAKKIYSKGLNATCQEFSKTLANQKKQILCLTVMF